jgi:hypothetical protein
MKGYVSIDNSLCFPMRAIIRISGTKSMPNWLERTGEIMWRINSAATELNLRARTLCFIVFLVLSGEACIYFVVRQFVSEI